MKHPAILAGLFASVAVVLGLTFFAGYQLAGPDGYVKADQTILGWNKMLQQQQQDLDMTRRVSEEKLDALSVQIAELNAQIIRLNALGRRLTTMADLQDGEFDFDSSPAVGGPAPDSPGQTVQLPDINDMIDALERELVDQERQLSVLENLLLNRSLSQEVHPEGRPVSSGWISSYFGSRTDPFTGKRAYHKGIDFAGRAGADVVAVASGVVSWSRDRYGYGLMVEINHGNGYFTRYAHNAENLVTVGDEIQKGQIIARMGETGRATGPNLHFEVLRNGKVVDPLSYIRSSK
jgi:murein DD-endopeptidase MepM/ murein hydrolase activator NlpD